LRVGINYPWLHCGWDFGPVPPGYGPRVSREELRADLTRLAQAGVSIVRWFVLADGFVYGTGETAPRREKGRFRFAAEAPLAPGFVDDFEALLALCAELGLSLLPVLIDHHFAFPGLAHDSEDARTLSLWDRTPRKGQKPSWRLLAARERASRMPVGYVKGGRVDVIADARATGRFIDSVLVPLLAASQRYEHAIYAWELINEPDWIMRRLPFEPGFRLPRATVCRFMEQGLGVIRDHGFVATVGFASARSLRSVQGELPALALNQLHYYPRGRFARLAAARFANGRPAIVGEFATESAVLGPWPDLSADRQQIAARLALARDKGYQAALLWSYRARDRATLADRALLEGEITRFARA
jgi:hypothetical protein